MPAFLSPVFGAGAQLFNNQGIILAGGKIYSYNAGTTTPVATYTDSTATVPNANPIILDGAGRVPNEIWINANTPTKFILQDSLSNVIGTWDNITGVNDTFTITPTITEWQATALTPAYVSPTSFSVSGNATSVFTLNRRVKATVTAGTVYGYITSSTYLAPSTTVVIQPDSTTLDTGLSAVSVGLLNSIGVSVPQQYIAQNAPVNVASASTTPIGAANSFNVAVTGTTTINAFDNVPAGVLRMVDFVSALTLTYNATSMILPGAANINVAASDQAIFLSLGGGNWECLFYQLAALPPGNANFATNSTNAVNATNVSFTGLDPRYAEAFFQLTATIVANAINITLATSEKLEFRINTLTTGGSTSIALASPLTLTLAAGASLGATTLVQARLPVLVVNNGGTPVLCISNTQGGLNYDETTLISPTLLGGASASPTTIYSASTVGTNLAFRVVGFIDATWTSGTGWTSIESVNPGGGIATAPMSINGQVWQTFTGAQRAAGTTYWNQTALPIMVQVKGTASAGGAFPQMAINQTGTPVTVYGNIIQADTQVLMTVPVPAYSSYTFSLSAGTFTFVQWAELR